MWRLVCCVLSLSRWYLVVVLLLYRRNQSVILNEMIDFATQYSTVQKRLLDEFEVPYAILDQNCRLMWMNQQFSEIAEKEKHYHKSVTGIFPQVNKDQVNKADHVNIKVYKDDRIYRASISKIYFSDMLKESHSIESSGEEQYLTIMYLFDETLLNQYLKEKQDMQMVSALVYIDNYDEVLESVEEVKQSLLVALVDRKVNKYFANQGGLVKKTEKDKYFVVFPHKYLEPMAKDNFSLLEDVKSLKVGNEMAVTLSMGIGDVGNDYAKNYGYTRMAIDLALGRGRRSDSDQDQREDLLFRRKQPAGG